MIVKRKWQSITGRTELDSMKAADVLTRMWISSMMVKIMAFVVMLAGWAILVSTGGLWVPAILMLLMLWGLDGYFLHHERGWRGTDSSWFLTTTSHTMRTYHGVILIASALPAFV